MPTFTEVPRAPRTVGDDLDLVNNLRNLYVLARNKRRERYDIWHRNYRLINNRMGSQAGLQANWAPSPRDSEIYPTISALVAWMTDQNTFIDLTPASDPHSPYYEFVGGLCNDLSAVLYSTWLAEDYNGQIKLALWDAFTYGVGIVKSVWDNAVSNGYGNALLRRVDPYSFYPDPNATSLEDAEYLIEARRMSFDELERRYPDKADRVHDLWSSSYETDERPNVFDGVSRVPKANPGALPGAGTLTSYSGSGQVRYGRPRSNSQLYDPIPGIVVYECWLRENSHWSNDQSDPDTPITGERHIEDKWRVVSFAGNEILLDEMAEDLWSHAQHPYERYAFDDIGEFYGISLVDHLAHPQIYINRLLTALQHNAELVGNPIFLEAAGSGTERTSIINRPGQRLTLKGTAAMQNKPDWLRPPDMPAGVSDLVQFWISRMENISGLSAIVRGATPTARNAEGVISSIQEAAFVRIRSGLRNLEKCLEKATTKLADLIIDNYTEPRYMAILGPDGEQSTLALKARHFDAPTPKGATPLKYTINIKAGAASPTSRQARMAEADNLFTLGVIDDEAVLEAHQYPRAKQVIQRKYEKVAAGAQEPGGPGARKRAGRSS